MLLRDQMPDLADLAISPLAEGWDNAIFRLGDELVVRLPRREVAVELLEHELRWLPELAPVLPLRIPAPVRAGRPGAGYPWAWTVCPWLPGEVVGPSGHRRHRRRRHGDGRVRRRAPSAALRLTHRAIRSGVCPLADRSTVTLERIDALADLIDERTVRSSWDELVVDTTDGPGRRSGCTAISIRSTSSSSDGRISAVIDFGDLNGGDPATDLSTAWIVFPSHVRSVFRAAAGDVDDNTWRRAEGWALASVARVPRELERPSRDRADR